MQDVALGQLQPLVRQLNGEDTVVNWLEPHEEMCHGVCDVLDDHGPNARLNFYRFLEGPATRRPRRWPIRWRQPGAFQTWDDVPFPEFATFLGWNETAIDLTGIWKISYDAPCDAQSAQDRSGRLGVGERARAGPRHRAGPAAQAGRLPPAHSDRSGLAGGPSAGLALPARPERHPRRIADEPRPRVRQRQGDPRESPVPRRIALGHAGGDLRLDRWRQPDRGLPAAGACSTTAPISPARRPASIRRWASGSTRCGPTSRTGPPGRAGRRSAAARR